MPDRRGSFVADAEGAHVAQATRRWAVGQDCTQLAAASRAVDLLREGCARAPGE